LSGHAQETFCRWTPSTWPGFQGPDTRSRATAPAPARRCASESAGSSATRSSTTTHASPTPRSTPTRTNRHRFVARALQLYAGHGIQPKRLQTDNAWYYIHNRSLADLLTAENIQHRRIPPRTPKRNGKIERATNRPSPESGATNSATATQTPEPSHYPSRSTTTTTPATTAPSQTGHPSAAFESNRGTTASGACSAPGELVGCRRGTSVVFASRSRTSRAYRSGFVALAVESLRFRKEHARVEPRAREALGATFFFVARISCGRRVGMRRAWSCCASCDRPSERQRIARRESSSFGSR
jgi:hypothetical protein